MKITFVNVGYGECILIQVPDAHFSGNVFTMLIDGGSGEAAEYADRSSGRVTLREYLKSIQLDHIDVMACTHIHEDHICGLLPVLEDLVPSVLLRLLPEDMSGSLPALDDSVATNPSQEKFIHALNAYQDLCRTAEKMGSRIISSHDPGAFRISGNISTALLAPSLSVMQKLAEDIRSLYEQREREAFLKQLNALDAGMNNKSLILMLESGGTKILLPGDTNRNGFGSVDASLLRADLYKIGHHGQKDGSSAELMEAIRPKAVVCCASSDRRYESACPDLIRMVEAHGAKMYYSDCPKLPGLTDDLRPHHALVFDVGENGALAAEYR